MTQGFALRLCSWQRERRQSLVGFAHVELETAYGLLEIRNIAVHENSGSRFVAMPAGAYIADGRAKYLNVLKWQDIAAFKAAVVALVERHDPEAFNKNGNGARRHPPQGTAA